MQDKKLNGSRKKSEPVTEKSSEIRVLEVLLLKGRAVHSYTLMIEPNSPVILLPLSFLKTNN